MRKAILILAIVLILVSLAIVPTLAGSPQAGTPQTNRGGNETGKAKQAGPGGPNYGKPTPRIIETPTPAPKSASGEGMIYTVYLPFVAKSASVQVSASVQLSSVPTSPGIWK